MERPEPAAYTPSGFFMLRVPRLTVDDYAAWCEPPEAGQSVVRNRLRDWVARPAVQEALFIASPDLYAALPEWASDPDGRKGRRAEQALARYFARMTTRPTPFGLFAMYAVGAIGPETRLRLADRCERAIRVDMEYLHHLVAHLEREPAIRRELRFFPNSSLYCVAGRFRHAKATPAGRAYEYNLVVTQVTRALADTLHRARGGARLTELAAALADEDTSLDEALAYVDQLTDAQLLVSELSPAITGAPAASQLLGVLQRIPAAAPQTRQLADGLAAAARIDRTRPNVCPDEYRAVSRRLDEICPVPSRQHFQVDLKNCTEVALGPEPLREIMKGIEILRLIDAGPTDDRFDRFKTSMQERFGSREVPLAEALDDEHGVGFGGSHNIRAPLLEDVALDDRETDVLKWTNTEHVLLRLLYDVWRAGARELVLTDSTVDALRGHPPPLPCAFVAQATLLARSPTCIDRGEFRVWLQKCFGPSGARWFGRFCQADAILNEHVARHLRDEESQQPEVIFAEVVHNSAPRLGNVICRPLLREYEVPILGVSGADPAKQIPLTDLLVSVVAGRVVLRSARLGREVIPRITSAIDYSVNGLKLAEFLSALQHQNVNFVLRWRWSALASMPYLPRVRYGKVILAPATWNLRQDDVQPVLGARGTERLAAGRALRERLRLPRVCGITAGDNVLPVDFDNPLSVESVVPVLRGALSHRLTELFLETEHLCVEGQAGRHTHEILIPFTRPGPPVGPPPVRRARVHVRDRMFSPGGEWLYLKLYAGPANCDRILRDVIAPLARDVQPGAAAHQWFFIRFADPDWHLRVRFRGSPSGLYREFAPRLTSACQRMLEEGLVWRVQVDTYDREVERFGGFECTQVSEQLFCEDSNAVVMMLRVLAGDGGAELRWRAALRGADALLSDGGLSLPEKREFAARRSADLQHALLLAAEGAPTPVGRTVRHQLDAKYRKRRRDIETALHPHPADGVLPPEILAAFRLRSDRVTPIFAELRKQLGSESAPVTLDSLLSSYVHLFLNRLLRAQHRKQELITYDFLWRYYRSTLARAGEAPVR